MIHLYFTSGALHRCCCFLHFNYNSSCHCVTFQGYPKQQAFTPPGTGQRGCKSKEGGWGTIRVEGSIVVCCLSCQCSVWPSCSNYKILIIMMKKKGKVNGTSWRGRGELGQGSFEHCSNLLSLSITTPPPPPPPSFSRTLYPHRFVLDAKTFVCLC